MTIILPARGRQQITMANEFADHTRIGYLIFEADSDSIKGYTKFYQQGKYRVAIPAVRDAATSDIYLTHIDSGAEWWTGVSLVNTTADTKNLTLIFNTGATRSITLNANEHKAFTISSLFDNQPQPSIRSAVITNASGIVGLELFGTYDNKQLEGIVLTDKTTSVLYYPHVISDGWWTGIVAYNPAQSGGTMTVTPYNVQGTPLSPATLSIAGKEKYVGVPSQLGLAAETAWLKIESTIPLSGFALNGVNNHDIAGYAGNEGAASKAGVFAKVEDSGWTIVAIVNTENSPGSVTLTAYTDAGTAISTRTLPIGSHAKVINAPEAIFPQDIASATYIDYSSDRNVVGFQLNGSADWTMLDGLPGM
ncbi:MAG: hypothetical protein ACYC7J_16840 [Syntrophales bacterium]